MPLPDPDASLSDLDRTDRMVAAVEREAEVRFVAGLAKDLIVAQIHATRELSIDCSNIVANAIGLVRETRRQLAEPAPVAAS